MAADEPSTASAPPSSATATAALRGIDWREAFPFTHLFRAFRIAVHPSKLLLALILLLGLYFGGRVLDAVWPHSHLVTAAEARRSLGTVPWIAEPQNAESVRGIFITFFNYEAAQVNNAAFGVVGLSLGSVIAAVTNFLFTGPAWLFSNHPLFATLLAIWFFVLWSVFGGAIARIAAVHVARDEKISVRQALRFSTGKVLSFFFAPVIPLLIVLALGALLAAGGLLLYVPVAGPILVGALLFLGLAVGFVITLVVLGTVGGFNLMYPTVAVEGSDSFDAISRSFSYVFAKPWRTLWYTLVAIAYGAVTYLFVRRFVWLVLLLTHTFLGWWLGDNTQPHAYLDGVAVTRQVEGGGTTTINDAGASIWPAPRSFDEPLPYEVRYDNLKWSEDLAAGLASLWTYLTIATLGAYAISYYFTANTLIYALLRREVDATDLDDVYVEQADEEFAEPAPAAPAAATATSPGASDASPSPDAPTSTAGTGGTAGTGTGTGGAKVYDAPDSVTPPEATPPPSA